MADLPEEVHPNQKLLEAFEADLPPLISDEDPYVQEHFLEFFLAEIRNENTRKAYGRAAARFLRWADRQELKWEGISPMAVSAYVEQLGGKLAPATVKQRLSAIRRLFGYLHAGNVLPENPAELVRGPKHNPRRAPRPSSPPRKLEASWRGYTYRIHQGQTRQGHHRRSRVHVRTRVRSDKDEAERLLPGWTPLEDSSQGKRRKRA